MVSESSMYALVEDFHKQTTSASSANIDLPPGYGRNSCHKMPLACLHLAKARAGLAF